MKVIIPCTTGENVMADVTRKAFVSIATKAIKAVAIAFNTKALVNVVERKPLINGIIKCFIIKMKKKNEKNNNNSF